MSYGSWVLIVTQNEKDMKTDTGSWLLGVGLTCIAPTLSENEKFQNIEFVISILAPSKHPISKLMTHHLIPEVG